MKLEARNTASLNPEALRALVTTLSSRHAFDAVAVAAADADLQADLLRKTRLEGWLDAGHAGEMDWMLREPEKRASPQGLWPAVKSVILLGTNYAVEGDPLVSLGYPEKATLALYALRRDYHDVIKSRLKALARDLVAEAGGELKVFVDTAPVMEKPLAMQAGLGWQGKHSVLVSRDFGNWLLLGAIYTTLAIAPDAPERDHCGRCRKCLDICPTDAFPEPYTLDARRCIAYLTIEHKGPIPREMRAKFGNRVFGCDDCLAVCPWNKFAKASADLRMGLREELVGLDLSTLAGLDDAAFRTLFAGTPVKRTGRERFVRNVLIAIGNSGQPALLDAVEPLLGDDSPLVRGAAVWAFSRLADAPRLAAMAARFHPPETDDGVRAEWVSALEGV